MATHSTAYIPTNRAPNEYIMSEGWSDGMLNSTGFSVYQSTPRLDESIRAVMLIDGSPVFAPAGSNALEVKEFDYIEENVSDMLDEDERAITDSVAATLQAIERGDWQTAESTAYGKMTLEEKMAKQLTQNASLHTMIDFSDLPCDYVQGGSFVPYDEALLVQALKEYDPLATYDPNVQRYTADVWGWYFYHAGLKQWWGVVNLPDTRAMLVPLIIGFFIEGNDTLQDVKALHRDYPDVYAKDIKDLATFEAARDAAR